MVTADFSYNLPLRPRITIKTIDGADTLYTFNAFSESNPITVTGADMENSVGENGQFSFRVADHDNQIGKDNLHHVKCYLELGKTEAALQHFMIGHANVMHIDRPASNFQEYDIAGFGTRAQAYRLFTHRREKFDVTDSDSRIWKIVRAALTKRLWRPLKDQDESIQDITGWDESGISQLVNIPYTVFDKAFVYFGDVMDELSSISGAVWFIDYSGGNEVFTLTYNPTLHTNVNVKSGDLASRLTDPSNTTAYIVRGFGVEDNATTEAGVATRLITTSVIDSSPVYEQLDGSGATTTTFRAIAQQVVIDNDARRLDSIELKLSKRGEPSSPKDRLNGDIVLDVNNQPIGTVLDEFNVSLSSIENEPKLIPVSDIDVSAKKLDAGQTKIWVRIFQRSNEEDENGDPDGNGNPNHGDEHTIKWHHDNEFIPRTLLSATANEGDAEKKDSLSWNTSDNGPLYSLVIKSNLRRLYSRTNRQAAAVMGLREQFIDTSFLSSPSDVSRYLSLNLSQTSKAKRSIQNFITTIPDNFLFRPYQLVSFQDGLSDIAQDLQVKRARYVLGKGDLQVGTLHAELSLGGLYNTLIGNCSCV